MSLRHPETEVSGYLAPVRLALTQPLLMGGAPRAYAILNGSLALAIIFAGAPVSGAVIGVTGHLAGVWLARRDPHILEVLQRAMRMPDHLEL